MKKELIVQIGSFTAVKNYSWDYVYNYYNFISFKGEAWKEKKEVYTPLDGNLYIDYYLYDEDFTIMHEVNLGYFSPDDYEEITHRIILAADKKKFNPDSYFYAAIENNLINLVNTYKNENNL